MPKNLDQKSTIDEIRRRFDADVERFSKLETGQVATIDAPLAMTLITQAAIASTPLIRRVLDVGCGAGNNAIKLREYYESDLDVDLIDLSLPMLKKAQDRLAAINGGKAQILHGDFRQIDLSDDHYDIVLAAAVLHHLRDDNDWQTAFEKLYRIIAPGGSLWITDLVFHETTAVQELMWNRYGEYLTSLGGGEYRDKVFAYIDAEDSPRSVTFQLDLLRKVGFEKIELLHKNSCFAAFGAIKPA